MAKRTTVVETKVIGPNTKKEAAPVCGIVMPISPIDGCSAEHWKEVKTIISEAVESVGYTANLVSDADDSGVIQKRIIRNLYENEIVVCDVSGKNPNVMFELGLRLAFDKPTIIIMDDNTGYSFDVSIIEHLEYPRNLTYYKIIEFKKKLSEKIVGTIQASKKANYTTFLKHFGNFTPATIDDKEGTMTEVIISHIKDLSEKLDALNRDKSNDAIIEFKPRSALFEKLNKSTDDEINRLTRECIELFINEKKISMPKIFEDTSGEREKLREYIELNHPVLCMLCKNKTRLQRAIDENVLPF